MNDLIRAAQVFNFAVPDYLDDTVTVGKICGVVVTAGEVRRLSQAIEFETNGKHDEHIVSLLRGNARIDAIKYRRSITGEGLAEAKKYVDGLGLGAGILIVKEYGIGYPEGARAW